MDDTIPTLSAKLLVPGVKETARLVPGMQNPEEKTRSAKQMLQVLGEFNKQITDMMIKLGTKNLKAIVALDFEFQIVGLSPTKEPNDNDCTKFRFRCYCNGGD